MKRALIVYYSWSNGNTERVAKLLQAATGADLLRIDTAVPYSGSYDEVVKQAQAKANEILSTSQLQARELKKATSDYVDSVLKSTEDQVAKSLAELRAKRQAIKAAKIG